MRTVEHTGQFKKDYKREAKGPHRGALETDLRKIIESLAMDRPLEPR